MKFVFHSEDSQYDTDTKTWKFTMNERFHNPVELVLDNISFTDLKLIIKKTDLVIACHGSPAHIASSFNTKIVDIFDEKNEEFYKFYTNHLRNYKYLYREDFSILAKNILKLV